jgi:outer membrane lipoprotein-sorting protein
MLKRTAVIKSAYTMMFLLLISHLTGCLAMRPPVEQKYTNGAAFESLSSNVSLSYKSPDRSISGNGYIVFRKPDQIRVVILSPFGSVLQEIYVSGERVTIIDPGNGIAFSGTLQDLPDKGDFSGWRYIHWLIDIEAPDSIRGTAVIERINKFGQLEKVAFENGRLISKTIAEGSHVRYSKYTAIQGVGLPLEIAYETLTNEKFAIQLEEPEINITVAEDTFNPSLSKLRVYPLSTLK